MPETGSISTGFFDSPWRRSEAVFLSPRRFPEYLRVQNIRDRTEDVAELSGGVARRVGGASEIDAAPDPARRDATVARIGDVPPVARSASGPSGGPAVQAQCPPAHPRSIDGLGRMIDLMA